MSFEDMITPEGVGQVPPNTVQINFRINFFTILGVVLVLHALVVFSHFFQLPKLIVEAPPERTPLKIRNIEDLNIRKVGAKDGDKKIDALASFRRHAPVLNNQVAPPKKAQELSLKDLSVATASQATKAPRPGTRPEVAATKAKALTAISLKGKEMQDFLKSSPSVAASGDPRMRQLSQSDVLVNLEVPEGVEPDELNKYELMFYGFQRRTAINYINAFFKNLDKFQRENPHLNFPMTENKQVMTGRLTYDEKGNVKQIKMIRWSNEQRLQDFFERVLKDMDTLHNPPQALWKSTGEFSIFFSFVVNG